MKGLKYLTGIAIIIFLFFSSFLNSQIISIGDTITSKFDAAHIRNHLPNSYTPFQVDSAVKNLEKRWEQRELEKELFIKSSINKPSLNNNKSDVFDCSSGNWGFENGDFSNWNASGCVSLQNSGQDPYSGNSNIHSGNYSVKLSSDDVDNCLNGMISRTVSVPLTGQTFLTFHFALSIYNYPHSAPQAAKFNVKFYDQAGNSLPCPDYEAYYTENAGPVGFSNLNQTSGPAISYNPFALGATQFSMNLGLHNVSYTQDWNHVTLDLTQYAGQDVTIFFMAEWCIFDVDWIYALIDIDCPVNTSDPTPFCADNFPVQLSAPSNMNASFEWYNNSNNLIGTNETIDVTSFGNYLLNIVPNYLVCNGASNFIMDFEIFESPSANFDLDDNICENQFIEAINTSVNADNYEWHYGNLSQTSNNCNFNFQNNFYSINLIAHNNNGCSDTLIKEFNIVKPPISSFVFSDKCLGDTYEFINQSYDLNNSNLSYEWNFDDGGNSNEINPNYEYLSLGNYHVSLVTTNEFNCSDTVVLSVSPYSNPVAEFTMNKAYLTETNNQLELSDVSSGNINNRLWNIDNSFYYSSEDVTHDFYEIGNHSISLIIENEYGCKDTAFNQIELIYEVLVFVPNVFTPNGDEHNHNFKPIISGQKIDGDYEFIIVNRWGQTIWQSNEYNSSWDGTFNGKICNDGTYFWKLKFYNKENKEDDYQMGYVSLVK